LTEALLLGWIKGTNSYYFFDKESSLFVLFALNGGVLVLSGSKLAALVKAEEGIRTAVNPLW